MGELNSECRVSKQTMVKIHDCTMHYSPISHFSQTVCRFWQTVYSTKSVLLFCGIWMVILKCTSLAVTSGWVLLRRRRRHLCSVCFRWWMVPWMWSRVLTGWWPAWALAWWQRLITWPFTGPTSVSLSLHTHLRPKHKLHYQSTADCQTSP